MVNYTPRPFTVRDLEMGNGGIRDAAADVIKDAALNIADAHIYKQIDLTEPRFESLARLVRFAYPAADFRTGGAFSFHGFENQ